MVEQPYRGLDSTYSALASPTRRAVLERLRGRPMRITDLADPFNMSLAAVSKHVGILESAGLVTRRIRGREHIVALEAVPLLEAGLWIDTYRRFWEERLDALEIHLVAKR